MFGEEAVVDQAAHGQGRRAAEDGGRRPGHQSLPGHPAGAGHAAARPRQPDRAPDRRPSDRRQRLTAAQSAKDGGADIYYVAAPLTFSQEVAAESLVLPQEVKFGEPFQAKVVAWSLKDTQGRLSLFRNSEFLGSQVVRLSAGKNVFSYRQSLEQSGIHVYQAALEVEGDTIEDNNRAVGTIVVRGRPQVLLADKDKGHAPSLAGALRSQNIDVTVVEPARRPRDIAGPPEVRRGDPVQRLLAEAHRRPDGAASATTSATTAAGSSWSAARRASVSAATTGRRSRKRCPSPWR